MLKIVYFLLLALVILIFYTGCGNDESSDDQPSISANSEVNLIGTWNLISYKGNTLPFIAYEIGTKKVNFTSEKMIFNDNGTFTNEQTTAIQDYEDKPMVTTFKGTYTIVNKDTLTTQLTEIIYTIPDEIKEFYKSVGIDIDKETGEGQIDKESYEPNITTFDLSDDILTVFVPVKDGTGKENLETYIYKKVKNQ